MEYCEKIKFELKIVQNKRKDKTLYAIIKLKT